MDRPDPLASNTTVRLRQTRPDPNSLYALMALAALLVLFGGFTVLWLATGSGTVGERGTFSPLGTTVWLAPLVACVAIYFAGPRGVLRVIWEPPVVLTLDDRGVAWTLPGPRTGFRALGWPGRCVLECGLVQSMAIVSRSERRGAPDRARPLSRRVHG
jgi:hypothetical protein